VDDEKYASPIMMKILSKKKVSSRADLLLLLGILYLRD